MTDIGDRYIDLLVRHLTGYRLDTSGKADHDTIRGLGTDWPDRALSMIGLSRMWNLVGSVRYILDRKIPGDLAECGVWRGGACILMRALLEVAGDRRRQVWCVDSFAGLPPPTWAEDEGDPHHTYSMLAVSEEEVRRNFADEGYADDRQVAFLPGFFEDTLPGPIDQLALLRLDGDMYGSIYTCLDRLYPKVSPGGIVIVDDYSARSPKRAVKEYGIDPERISMTSDGNAGWWVKPQ